MREITLLISEQAKVVARILNGTKERKGWTLFVRREILWMCCCRSPVLTCCASYHVLCSTFRCALHAKGDGIRCKVSFSLRYKFPSSCRVSLFPFVFVRLQIEDGGLSLQPESFDLHAMIRVTMQSFKDALQGKSLTLVMQLPTLEEQFALALPPGEKLLVQGDKYRLRQVSSRVARFMLRLVGWLLTVIVLHVINF
jgi:hypothetical protein